MDQNLKIPLVSVLMPVYNSEDYVAEAIESILGQTYSNFEFLIVNDSSTDNSLEIISSYKDSRIRVLNMKQNSGISKTLNFGIGEAKGKYIARMDSDDKSFPERIKKQVEFLENNKNYILCGSNYKILNSTYEVVLPENHSLIKTTLLSNCCIAHPTVMCKTEAIKKNNLHYSKESEPAEDYHLWSFLISKGKFYNLQENLLEYRVHEKQISQSKKAKQDKMSFSVKINYIKSFYKDISNDEINILERLLLLNNKMKSKDIKIFSDYILKMKKINVETSFFNEMGFKNYTFKLENAFLKNYFSKYERYSCLDFLNYLKISRKHKLNFSYKNATNLFFKSLFFYKIKTRSL
ncbi:MAG: glycosyltransferase family 2 protein [Polaribacter sp.]|uniref:glycosyltransferase family 2 protein n=1 Tax=Polaribacter sp. TaxID=1920175 RepID=UPI002F355735